MDQLYQKFSSLHIAKKLWNTEKAEEIAALQKGHQEALRDRDRMIDAQEFEIKVMTSCKSMTTICLLNFEQCFSP